MTDGLRRYPMYIYTRVQLVFILKVRAKYQTKFVVTAVTMAEILGFTGPVVSRLLLSEVWFNRTKGGS